MKKVANDKVDGNDMTGLKQGQEQAARALDLVERFFSLTDSGRLFYEKDLLDWQDFRDRLSSAFVALLFWHRPVMECERGISWIYEEIENRRCLFEAHLRGGRSFASRQALFFLGRIPFPGQWKWTQALCSKFGADPEVASLLFRERRTVAKKLAKKPLSGIRPERFCQVLKAPALPEEKGVLRIFSMPYLFYFMPDLLRDISKTYFLYVEPAAGLSFRHSWLRIYTGLDDPVLFGLASGEDRDFLGSQPNILAISLAHGDYLTDAGPWDGRDEKKYDLVFNNTFDEMDRKRHALMLDLMKHPLLDRTRVLFLGRGQQENIRRFKATLVRKGLDRRADVVANIPRRQVPAYLARCRAGVHLALQENGCRAVYEYFMAGLPCILSSATAGVNPEIITPKTGTIVPDAELAGAIDRVLRTWEGFEARQWFLKFSGSENSSKALNQCLKKIFFRLGYAWHRDIVPITSSGIGRYASKEDQKAFSPLLGQIGESLAGRDVSLQKLISHSIP